jgi:hypothetical protein
MSSRLETIPEKGNYKAAFVRARLFGTSALEPEAVWQECREFDGEAEGFKPLVVLPAMMLQAIARDAREKSGLRRVLAKITRRS